MITFFLSFCKPGTVNVYSNYSFGVSAEHRCAALGPRRRRSARERGSERAPPSVKVFTETSSSTTNLSGSVKCGKMGASRSAPQEEHFEELAARTGFSLEQIVHLHKRFNYLTSNKSTLRRENFDSVTDLTWNPIRSEIVEAFFDKRNFQHRGKGSVQEINFEEFLTVMSHFRPPELQMTAEQREGLRTQKLRFLFNMYDTDSDGKITLQEYRHVVEELLSRSGAIGKDTAKEIADAAMLEVASITVVHMEPDEFYEGITFEQFVKILKDIEIESKMYVRFLNMDATTLCR
ncbi:calcineurin B homologous protein 3 isoform X1 [Arapaima gigas]